MRVLWFSPIVPRDVVAHFNQRGTNRAGWIDSLVANLKSVHGVVLAIASISNSNYDSLKLNGVTYYNIYKRSTQRRLTSIIAQRKSYAGWEDYYKRCITIIEDFKADIIHVHGSENFFGMLIELTDVPIVISLQGMLNVCVHNFFNGFQISDHLREIISVNLLRNGGPYNAYRRMKQLAKRATIIMQRNKYFMGRTKFDEGLLKMINAGATYFCCNEMLREPFYNVKWSKEKRDYVIIYSTTSGASYKGTETLIDACGILAKCRSHLNLRIRIAGELKGWDIWGLVHRRLKRNNLYSRVEFLNDLDASQIANELKTCDVFVLPSHIENSSNSLCEAMAVGAPCVAAFSGGVPSLLEGGVGGLLYQDTDPFSLANQIEILLGNDELCALYSENARNTAHLRHDRERIVQTTISAYEAIVSSGQ